MRWSEIGEQDCSVARTLSVIGDRWTMLVLREAFMRTRRFDDFQRNTGAPRPILADRLRVLVDTASWRAARTEIIPTASSTA